MLKKIGAFLILALLLYISEAFLAFCDDKETFSPISLTLEKAISIAYQSNKDIQIQEQEIKAARANILDANSKFLPKATIEGSYTYNEVVPRDFAVGKKDGGIFTGYKSDNKAGVSIDEVFFDGGADIANLKQARLELKVQNETLRAKKLEIEYDAKRLYYGLLLAYETERIMKNLVSQAEQHLKDVTNRFEAGTSSKFDLLQSRVHLSTLIPDLVNAENSVALITAELKKLLSIKQYAEINVEGRLEYTPIEVNEGFFLEEAYLNRPEIILKILGVDIDKWGIEMAKAGWRPNITGSFDYGYRSNDIGDMINSRHSKWNIGVQASLDVFDGFSTKAKVDEAKSKYKQSILSKEDLIDQTAVDIRKATLDLIKSEAIIKSQKDEIVQAEEALKISEARYDSGVGTNLDVLDAQVSLSQIEKNLAEGIYDYLMAEAFLDRTRGKQTLKE